MNVNNTPQLETKRVILRKFNANDLDDLFTLYSDKTVNEFLPWFPHESREKTREFLDKILLKEYEKPIGYWYAIQLKENNRVIGFIALHNINVEIGSGDLGYALLQEYWGKGLIAECCLAVIEQLKKDGFTYIIATHDKNNLKSGRVMQKIGMQYKYSYVEMWKPKNIEVTFRMYQLNFDGADRTHLEYWDKYPNHFIENIADDSKYFK